MRVAKHTKNPVNPNQKGVLLENLTWLEAEKVLKESTVIVIPLGAAAKEHGPHLKLNNDWLMAEYLKEQVLYQVDVVVAPTVNYHYYPAFVEYPGSTSLRLETARDLIIDVCRSLAQFGPKKFYCLNTGVSTLRPLKLASESLAEERIILHFSDIITATEDIEKKISQQEGGTHADEMETSMMLYIAPDKVDMEKAVKDYHPYQGVFSRTPESGKTYSVSGVWGDPTLATVEKGQQVVHTFLKAILKDLEVLSQLP